jgi:hypothetical protein
MGSVRTTLTMTSNFTEGSARSLPVASDAFLAERHAQPPGG